MKKFANDIVI